jgi:hypothetical protein
MTVYVDADKVLVDWWNERDRLSIVAYADENRDVTLGEWWDMDAHGMIEDGFFKWGEDDTVIDYLLEIGRIDYQDPDA